MKAFGKRLTAVLMALCLTVAAAYAAEADKTLFVSADGEYKTIQEAVDAAADAKDGTGWTIEVSEGIYDAFTVPEAAEGLTVCASENTEPVIRPEADTGISVFAANVTLSGLVIEVGNGTVAAVTAGETVTGLSLRDCTLRGDNAKIGLDCPNAAGLTVENCRFSGFASAVSLSGNDMREETELCRNTFTDCENALTGDFTGKAESVLVFRENEVTGTAEKRCCIALSDIDDTGALIANLRDNTLTYVSASLENMEQPGEVISAFSEKNELRASVLYDTAMPNITMVPKTGDPTPILLWACSVLLLGSCAVLFLRKAGKQQ